jgi:hypothetical protein
MIQRNQDYVRPETLADRAECREASNAGHLEPVTEHNAQRLGASRVGIAQEHGVRKVSGNRFGLCSTHAHMGRHRRTALSGRDGLRD